MKPLRARWSGENIALPVLLPTGFRWRDPATNLVHHGALVKTYGDGKILGYTKLCTDVLGMMWPHQPPDEPSVIDCFECLGAQEQDE